MKLEDKVLIAAFTTFVLTTIAFTFILEKGFVSKEFLRMNRIYLDGKVYRLCREQ